MDNGKSVTLAYFSSLYVMEFITKNPIQWKDFTLSRRGGLGDQAGITPTPAVQEFLTLLRIQQDLFTQKEYFEYSTSIWQNWWQNLTKDLQTGVEAKLYNNFYVSMIDSLHVWAMLCEAGWYDICVLDSYSDAIAKTDLTLRRGALERRVALVGPTAQARKDLNYKRIHRGSADLGNIVTVQMSYDRLRNPGNKRWYTLSDFKCLEGTMEETGEHQDHDQSLGRIGAQGQYSFASLGFGRSRQR